VILSEMIMLFLNSRRRGTEGAKRKASKSTMDIYRRNLKEFANFLSDAEDPVVNYTRLRSAHVTAFVDFLEEKAKREKWHTTKDGLCPTVLQVLRTLKTFFLWVDRNEECRDAGLRSGLQRNLPAIPKNPRRQDIPEVKTLKAFKNAFNTDTKHGFRNYVVTTLLMDTGLRSGEVASLTLDAMKLNENTLLVSGKTGVRFVPVSSEMVRLLKAWLKKRTAYKTAANSPYVFPGKYGPQMTRDAIHKMYYKHRAKHGFVRVTAHTFRHAFVTNWLRKGGSLDRLKNITGHKTYEMLNGYVQEATASDPISLAQLEKVSMLKDEDD
jgi:integrase/recombinase XerD